MTTIATNIPTVTVMIGAPGAGKSTIADGLEGGLVLSLDALRAELTGDECDQAATPEAVALLRARLDAALAAGTSVVVDGTNARPDPDRAGVLAIAQRRGATAFAVVVDTPLDVCLARNAARPGPADGALWGRRVPDEILTEMHTAIADLDDATLRGEGFAAVRRI